MSEEHPWWLVRCRETGECQAVRAADEVDLNRLGYSQAKYRRRCTGETELPPGARFVEAVDPATGETIDAVVEQPVTDDERLAIARRQAPLAMAAIDALLAQRDATIAALEARVAALEAGPGQGPQRGNSPIGG